jgi:hypothetical protein
MRPTKAHFGRIDRDEELVKATPEPKVLGLIPYFSGTYVARYLESTRPFRTWP